ncbi:MAG: cellulose biosynthesis cyclic di-GMP-binding regulatory protein BcsB, partial [Myxococcota bacterium]
MKRALFAALLLLVQPGNAFARREPTSFSFGAEPVVLRGASVSALLRFEHAGQSRVDLRLRASSLLSRTTTVLTLVVDGVPHASRRLGELTNGQWTIELAGLDDGSHELSLLGHLQIDDDPCLERLRDAAWLTILPASNVQSEIRATPSTLATYPLRWARAGEVRIDPPARSAGSALAMLDAVALIAHAGARPTLMGEASLPALAFASLNAAEPIDDLAALINTLRRAQNSARAAVLANNDAVYVVGRTYADVQDAFIQLRSEATRALCPEDGPCILGPSDPSPSEPVEARPPHQVLSLRDLGHSLGWAAEGSGTHRLRFYWPRPDDWTLTSEPELQLEVRYTDDAILDSGSTLTVRVGGAPLATWSVGEASGAQRFRVHVPRSHWTDGGLLFDLEASLRAREARRCEHTPPLWLVVEGSSRLLVERTQRVARGIAGFFARAAHARPFIAPSTNQGWGALVRTGEMLLPFSERTPLQRWEAPRASGAYIEMRTSITGALPIFAERGSPALHAGVPIPALDPAQTDLLALSPNGE